MTWVASGNQKPSHQTGVSVVRRVWPLSAALLGVWWGHFRTRGHHLLEGSGIRTVLLLNRWLPGSAREKGLMGVA